MGKYWLLDRHGADGPSALVETDGSMRVVDVLRFGPDVTELEDQQKLLDDVMGRVAPTMKPLVPLAKLAEEGVDLHADLQHAGGGSNRTGRRKGGRQAAANGRAAGGPKRGRGRG
jgi:hypothetical protein